MPPTSVPWPTRSSASAAASTAAAGRAAQGPGQEEEGLEKAILGISEVHRRSPSWWRRWGSPTFERFVLLLAAQGWGARPGQFRPPLMPRASGGPKRLSDVRAGGSAAARWSLEQPHSPAALLRFWRLVEVEPGGPLTTSPLRIDEWVLHYLAGEVLHLDWQVAPKWSLERVRPGGPVKASRSGGRQPRRWAEAWTSRGVLPIVDLTRDRRTSRPGPWPDVATAGIDRPRRRTARCGRPARQAARRPGLPALCGAQRGPRAGGPAGRPARGGRRASGRPLAGRDAPGSARPVGEAALADRRPGGSPAQSQRRSRSSTASGKAPSARRPRGP